MELSTRLAKVLYVAPYLPDKFCLTEAEKWSMFKKSDSNTPFMDLLCDGEVSDAECIEGFKTIEEWRTNYKDGEPIVEVLVDFAIETFNCLSEEEQDAPKVNLVEIIQSKYLKAPYGYFNYFILKVEEDRQENIYEAIVLTDHEKGVKTLVEFYLKHQASVGDKEAESALTITGKQRYVGGGKRGLTKRMDKANCRGYNYFNPSEVFNYYSY